MAMAFRISLSGLFSFLGLVMLGLGILLPGSLTDVVELPSPVLFVLRLINPQMAILDSLKGNALVIVICLIVAFEIVVFAACHTVSKLNGDEKRGKNREVKNG